MKRIGLVKFAIFVLPLTALLAIRSVAPCQAQDSRIGALRFGLGARAFGMGRAFTAIADDPSAIYWNAAGISQLGRPSVLLAYADRFGAGIRDHEIVAALPLHGTPLSIAAGLTLTSVGDIKRTRADANGRPIVEGTFDDGESVGLIAVSLKLPFRVSVGSAVKYYRHELDQRFAYAWGIDIGVLAKPVDFVSVGVNAQDLNTPTMRWDGETRHEDSMLKNVKTGASITLLDNTLRLSIDVDDATTKNRTFHGGTEYSLFGHYAVRTGLSDENFSAGGSVNWRGIRLDYALLLGDLGDSHRVAAVVSL